MGSSHETTIRFGDDRIRSGRPSVSRLNGGIYFSRSVSSGRSPTEPRPPADEGVRRFRELARSGRLAEVAEAAGGPERVRLSSAAYQVAWPIVFARLTRRFEQARGHDACAVGVSRLAPECLDRFHDDVESAVEDVLRHARHPLYELEGWIASRLQAATVDGHRRMRGRRGALQRPRLPGWLAEALRHDEWLTALAVEILIWVGVSATAGTATWPLESWAYQRGLRTGDWAGSDAARVAREVEKVLAAMRRRPAWYDSYVEQPLGTKQTPVATDPGEQDALDLGDPDGPVDTELHRLAGEAMRAIGRRLVQGGDPEATVVEVIRTVFGGAFTGTLDRAPHTAADPLGGVTGALADPRIVGRIVGTVMSILGEERRAGRA